MLDNPQFKKYCPCPQCQIMRRRGLHADTHKYDDIHAEDASWTFKLFCRCRLCRNERRQLAQRVIKPSP